MRYNATGRRARRLASFPMANPSPVMELDLQGNVTYCNHAGVELFPGLQEEGLRHPWLAGVEPVLRSFREGTRRDFTREVRVGERWYSQRLQCLRGLDHVHLYGLDISERKIAEQRLAAKAALLQATIDAAGSMVFSVDREFRYTSFNRAHLEAMRARYGTTVKLGDSHLDATTSEEDRHMAERHISEAFRGERVRGETTSGEDQEGRRYHEVSLDPVLGSGGEVEGVVAVAREVTDHRKAVELQRRLHEELELRVAERTAELELANRELEGFTYSIAHDLRAPLRAIDGFSRIVLEDVGERLGEETTRHLVLVRANAQHMGRQIDDLLRYTGLGKQPLRVKQVDTAAVVHEVLQELGTGLEGRRVGIDVQELPPCRADAAMLRQLWLELLANSLKFTRTREDARIRISFVAQSGSVEGAYSIEDNGVGFDMKHADRLFGVFQRLHRREDFPGTGMGLAIVQRIVHRHGGRVWASATPDQGATFFFTLGTDTHA